MDIQSEKEKVEDLKKNRLLIFSPGPKMELAQPKTFPNSIVGKNNTANRQTKGHMTSQSISKARLSTEYWAAISWRQLLP